MSVPPTLLIDTSGPRLALGLARPGEAIDSETRDIARGHAEIVFDAIADLLARNEIGYGALGRVAALSGPGSFTGLRVGLSAARGLGLALKIPVLGIPNLVALSLSHSGPVTVVLDARRGEAYRQAFAGPAAPLGPPELVALETALTGIGASAPHDPFCEIGLAAVFAAGAEPADFPPIPLYVRAADAKPQTRGKVALQ